MVEQVSVSCFFAGSKVAMRLVTFNDSARGHVVGRGTMGRGGFFVSRVVSYTPFLHAIEFLTGGDTVARTDPLTGTALTGVATDAGS